MKNKVLMRIALIILVTIMLIVTSNTICMADNFDLTGFEANIDANITKPVDDVAGAIVGVMRIVCTGIAIIMLMTIGIKYLSAAPGERAELKKSAVQYVVGAVIFFGAAGILTMLSSAINEIV